MDRISKHLIMCFVYVNENVLIFFEVIYICGVIHKCGGRGTQVHLIYV